MLGIYVKVSEYYLPHTEQHEIKTHSDWHKDFNYFVVFI